MNNLEKLKISTQAEIIRLTYLLNNHTCITKNAAYLVEAIERLGEIDTLIDFGIKIEARGWYITNQSKTMSRLLLSVNGNYPQDDILQAKAILKLYDELGV